MGPLEQHDVTAQASDPERIVQAQECQAQTTALIEVSGEVRSPQQARPTRKILMR